MGTRWRGLLAPVDTPTGDGRRFLGSGIKHRELPLPLKWQRSDEMGHDTSVIVGLVDTINIENGGVWGEGELFDDLNPKEYERLVDDVAEAKLLLDKKVIGPSVDAGEVEMVLARPGSDEPLSDEELDQLFWEEMETGETAEIEVLFTIYEIAAATLVGIPAFSECRPFELLAPVTAALTAAVRSSGWNDFPLADRDLEWSVDDAEARIADDAGIGGDDPGWGRYAEAFLYAKDDADPELKGTYRFLILDVVDGERRIIPRAVFAVAEVLQGARGGTTIPEVDQQAMKDVVGGLYRRMAEEFDDDTIVAPWEASYVASVSAVLGAAGVQVHARSAFFPPENLGKGLVPITVTDTGLVYGHIATHDVCHMGIPGVCTTAPVDLDGFDRFHRYPLSMDDGEIIAVGRITFGAGRFVGGCSCCRGNDDHACSRLSMGGAIAHHDKMITVAWVRAWEDQENNAIRVAGVICPDVPADAVKALARGKVSGDWRAVGGDLALVEVLTLSRELPGFPLPRARMASGQMMALTAAGTVGRRAGPRSPTVDIDYDRLAGLVAERLSDLSVSVSASGDTTQHDDHTLGVDGKDDRRAEAATLTTELDHLFAQVDQWEATLLAKELERICVLR